MRIFENLENLQVSEECFSDIMGIVEEIINEVSVGMWKRAAENSLPKREKTFKKAEDEAINKELTDERHDNYIKTKSRFNHANDIASNYSIPKGRVSTKKYFKAVDNSLNNRDNQACCQDTERNVERANRAGNLYDLSPYKK